MSFPGDFIKNAFESYKKNAPFPQEIVDYFLSQKSIDLNQYRLVSRKILLWIMILSSNSFT